MNTITFTIGVPCSGKSTWAKQQLKENENLVRVNRDDFRYMLRNKGILESDLEGLVTGMVQYTVNKALNLGKDVIIDETNVRRKYLNAAIGRLKGKADLEFKFFEIDRETADSRNLKRYQETGILIPDDVMDRMFDAYNFLKENWNFLKEN